MRLVTRNGIKKLAARSERLSSGASSRNGLELSLVRAFEDARAVLEGENMCRYDRGGAKIKRSEKYFSGTECTCVAIRTVCCIIYSYKHLIFSIKITKLFSNFVHFVYQIL